jgi:hypothetical protein
MSLPLNVWLSVPNTWRPNYITRSVCLPFLFHRIRPATYKVQLAEYSGEHRNGARTIVPGQVSAIVGIKPGFFQCVTLTSTYVDGRKLYSAQEFLKFLEQGDASVFYLYDSNFFQGAWEAFNGPNPISIA